MSSSRYEQHPRYHNGGGGRSGSHYGNYNASPNRATSTTANSSTTETPAPVLDQIANLLHLAQNLMHGFKEQRSSGPQRHTSRRNQRIHGSSPYQRVTAEAQRILQNSYSNSNSHSNANGGPLSAPQFCKCGECSARTLRSEVVPIRNTGRGVAGGAVGNAAASSTSGSGAACSANYSHNNVHHNSKNFQCSICLESYLTQRPMATLCGHIFCRLCILECLNRQGKCPICNRKLNLTNVFRVFF